VPAGAALEALRRKRNVLQVVVNKVDEGDAAAIEALKTWSSAELGVQARRISALTGAGLEELGAALTAALPISPFFYPEDELAVQPVRFFVAELVRETVFEEYAEEVPYATVVRVEEYRENAEPIYIRATIYVERDSQKGIILGKAGAGIRALGARAREKIESFVGAHVYLDLWVKTLPGWRRKVDTLRYLGYRVPESAMQAGESSARATRDRHGSRKGERPGPGAGKSRGGPSRPPARPQRSDEKRGRGHPRKES
jgi:GTP-binding protein Era